jgi:hypothetical protein
VSVEWQYRKLDRNTKARATELKRRYIHIHGVKDIFHYRMRGGVISFAVGSEYIGALGDEEMGLRVIVLFVIEFFNWVFMVLFERLIHILGFKVP